MYSLCRLISFGLTIAMFYTIPQGEFFKLTSSFGMAHYVMAILGGTLFVKVLPQAMFQNPSFAVKIFIILCISVFAAVMQVPSLLFLFGVHHVLSEVYYKEFKINAWVNGVRFLLNFIVYYGACTAGLLSFSSYAMLSGLVFVALLATLALTKVKVSAPFVKDLLVFEALGVVAGLFMFREHAFTAFVMYHVVIWYSLQILMKTNPSPTLNKVKRQIEFKPAFLQLFLGVAFYLVMWGLGDSFTNKINAVEWIFIGGFFHITLSFFTAKNNPDLILKLQQKWIFKNA